MLQEILGIIKKEELMRAGELVIAGVSGGADSICLLSVLLELKERLGIRMAAVHVHHGIRGTEADRDEAFVRTFCKKRGVPLLVYHRNVPEAAKEQRLSEEEAGRNARYECFYKALLKLSGNRIAVAHNRDDNAETVLFHLFRGSGLKGLSGMGYKAHLPLDFGRGLPPGQRCVLPYPEFQGGVRLEENRLLVRPLLDISRVEIEEYLKARGISYCQDSTNCQEGYSRNRIRLSILPEARRINGEAAANIVRAAGLLKETEGLLNELAENWLKEQAVFGEQDVRLPGRALAALRPVLSGLVLRKVLESLTGSLKDLTKQHTDKILALAEQGTGRRLSLPGGVVVQNEYGILVFSGKRESGSLQTVGNPGTGKVKAGIFLVQDGETEEYILEPEENWKEAEIFGKKFRYRCFKRESGQKIPENRYTKWFAYDKIKGNLSLRGRRPGDWFQAFACGGRQSVKAYMINEKIPPKERGRIPLLVEESHVLWIVGGRISEAYKVTEKCGWVLEISAIGT